MAESIILEIYELETYASNTWGYDPKLPWTGADGHTPASPPDEALLPGPEWTWASNWRIDKKPGCTDADGWEYARYAERFLCTTRATKVSRGWRDASRRRKWSRVMRRDARAGLAAQFQDAMPKIQNGLRSINAVRMRLEMVARAAPEELHKKQMLNLIESVRNNMHDTLALLNRLDTTDGANQKQATVIKKLKNDLAKEEAAIDAVVTLAMTNQSSPGTGGNGNASPSVNSSSSSSGGSHSKVNKASPSMSRGNVRQQERDREKQQMARELQQRGSGDSSSRRSKTTKASSEEGFFGDGGGIASAGAAAKKATPRPSKVVSGGRNQPLDLSRLAGGGGRSSDGSMGAEDGVFVQRTAQEQVILDKLIPIDEATVQAHIIEERSEAIEQIHKGLVEINDMFTDLSKLIKQQEGEVETISNNADESNARTEEAFNQILEANRLQKETCIIS